jgi:hypothetical protein
MDDSTRGRSGVRFRSELTGYKLLWTGLDACKPMTADQNIRLINEFRVGRLRAPYDDVEFWHNGWVKLCERFRKTGVSTGVNETHNKYTWALSRFNRVARNMLKRYFGGYEEIRDFRAEIFLICDED